MRGVSSWMLVSSPGAVVARCLCKSFKTTEWYGGCGADFLKCAAPEFAPEGMHIPEDMQAWGKLVFRICQLDIEMDSLEEEVSAGLKQRLGTSP